MKKVIWYLTFYSFSFLIITESQGQQSQHECGMPDPYQSSSLHINNSCINSSVNSNADNASYIPEQNDPNNLELKIIRVVIHVMQFSSSDPRNFDNSTDHINHIKGLVNNVANTNLLNPIDCPVFNSGGACTGDPFIIDSKIRLYLDDNDIYFWQDTLGWNNTGAGNTVGCPGARTYVFDNYAVEPECKLNIFLIENELLGWAGCGPGYLGEGTNFVLLNRFYTNYINNLGTPDFPNEVQEQGVTLTHKIGHNLGLHHTDLSSQQNLFSDIYDDIRGGCDPGVDADCSTNIMANWRSWRNWLSPLQIAHMHRLLIGSWRSKLLKVDYSAAQSIIINTNTTWAFGKVVYGDVTVKSGSTLTIECVVIMPPGGKIIVEKGARLIVDGGQITIASPNCGDYWTGIEVLGDPTLAQTTANQGVVELLNGAIIEYANNAITTGTNGNGSLGGAIIQADDAVFRNNRRSVEFMQYTLSDNLSYFTDCTFELTADYPQSTYIGMVTAWDVRGVAFTNCTFSNASPVSNKQYAIYTIAAGFDVSNGCTFDGFTGGIYSTAAGSINTITVDDATFSNNALGVYVGSMDNILLSRCTVNVGQYRTSTYNHGVYLDNSTGYQVEENNFNGFSQTLSPFPTGVICYNTGDLYNRIYNNDFDGLDVANRAYGDNVDKTNPFIYGLEYLCNTNTNNTSYDFSVVKDPMIGSTESGIKEHQGYSNYSAGNTFSLNSSPVGSDFSNKSSLKVRYYYGTGTAEYPVNVFSVTRNAASANHACSSTLSMSSMTQMQLTVFEEEYNQNRADYDQNLSIYNEKIDDGNTEELIRILDFASDEDATEIEAKLLSISPWLSSIVIEKAIEKQEIFSRDFLFNLLRANPDALPKEDNLRVLFSSNEIEELQNVTRNESTERTILEGQLASEIRDMHTSANVILHHYRTAGELNFKEIITWLENKMSLVAQYQIVESWLQEGNMEEAENVLRQIPAKFSLSASEEAAYQDYRALTDLITEARKEGRTIADFNETEVAILVKIADRNHRRAGVQAKGILNFFYDYNYIPETALLSDEIVEQRSNLDNPTNELLESSAETNPISIFPNPTDGVVTFSFDVTEYDLSSGVIQVIDVNGRILKEFVLEQPEGTIQWNTDNLQPGIYLYQLRNQGNILTHGRFLISR